MIALANLPAWLGAVATTRVGPKPSPTPGFDFNSIHPDPDAVPRSDLFYMIANAMAFLAVIAVVVGALAGLAALAVGPIFGSHHVADRAKSMLLRCLVSALGISSLASILAFLMKQ